MLDSQFCQSILSPGMFGMFKTPFNVDSRCGAGPPLPQPSRRSGHTPQQPEGPGTTESCLHDGGHRHRGRDVFAVHRAAGAHERVPRPRTQRAERRPQVALLPLRVHRGDGQRLHLRRDAAAGRRTHGQVGRCVRTTECKL